MTTVPHIARKTARVHRMLETGCPVLLMVSGGADSVTLLHLFAAGEFGEHRLRVLHVNHLLRAGHSDGDEAFVLELCGELGVECRVVRYDVAGYALGRGSISRTREGRFVTGSPARSSMPGARSCGVDAITGRVAVAHTLDDRVETFFMRAIAGVGSGGLNALAPVRERIVRPLIDVDGVQVRAWLGERGVSVARGRVERGHRPIARPRAPRADARGGAAEPGVAVAIVRTMDLLADDDALLSRMADAFARDFARCEPGERSRVRPRVDADTRSDDGQADGARGAARGPSRRHRGLKPSHVEALVEGSLDETSPATCRTGSGLCPSTVRLVILRTDAQVPRMAPSLLSVPGSADLGAGRRHLGDADRFSRRRRELLTRWSSTRGASGRTHGGRCARVIGCVHWG